MGRAELTSEGGRPPGGWLHTIASWRDSPFRAQVLDLPLGVLGDRAEIVALTRRITVQVSEEEYAQIRSIAEQRQESMASVLHKLVGGLLKRPRRRG